MRDGHYLDHTFGELPAFADKDNVSRLLVTWNRLVICAKLLVQIRCGLSPLCELALFLLGFLDIL